ncbi:hypothetical protein Q3G72_034139 [Acer saccharum]|nr:hypothetical protein Q3G72_034139 [Acer saccharum]
MTCCVTNARPLLPSSSLVARLKLEDELPNCWNSLIRLQSCTGEIILFFLNGFTIEGGDILEGYCDHETADDNHHHTQSPPSRPSIVPTKVTTLIP